MKWNWLYVLWIGFTLLAFGTSVILGFAMIGMLAVLVRIDAGVSVLKQIYLELRQQRLDASFYQPLEPLPTKETPRAQPVPEFEPVGRG
ncbi:MAG: hypothetical protein HC933_01430 [Pleurocapsa sp. SU_196_0]|nr:hypothetical protein [Pleurocapsa sp. SU_196_0]